MQKIRSAMLFGLVCGVVLPVLAAPAAEAALISKGIVVTVTTATAGNPVNAVVGVQGTLGNLVYDDGDLTGSGAESLAIRSAGESLTLPIGSEVFDEADDVELLFFSDVPAAEFLNGVIQGLDFFVFFAFDAGANLVTKTADLSDLGQDMSGFIGDFSLDVLETGNFRIAQITGFVTETDEFGTSFEPVTGANLVAGTLTFVPEPSSGLLLGFGLVAFGIRRRIAALR